MLEISKSSLSKSKLKQPLDFGGNSFVGSCLLFAVPSIFDDATEFNNPVCLASTVIYG